MRVAMRENMNILNLELSILSLIHLLYMCVDLSHNQLIVSNASAVQSSSSLFQFILTGF